uniref:BTB domain-containing protein n=1 Tax=Arundo donax TaxID=35708 RepID=A0A0A9C5Q0_ARUDO
MQDFSYVAGVAFHDFISRAWLEESGHLVHDRFTVRCDVRTEERGAEPPAPTVVVVPPPDLHRHLGGLLEAKDGADVTFQVAGETFSAHRCVLAARSPVLKAELFGAMKESSDAVVIRVDDMEADVFRALLGFVYTDTLQDDLGVKQRKEAAMAQHLLVAADRYSLERLKLICEDKLCKHIDTGLAATILTLAEQHNCRGLKKACLQFLSCPSTLNDVMETDGFEHLARSCPSVLKELISNVSTCVPVDLGEARRRGWNGMLSSGRRTNYWYQALVVLVVLCVVLSLKRGNAPLSCICLVIASFVGTTINGAAKLPPTCKN